MNLYEFSQVNNNEMGVLLKRSEDSVLYKEAYDEAQRLVRISEEVRISLERVEQDTVSASEPEPSGSKLTTSKLSQKLGCKTAELLDRLGAAGYLEVREEKHFLTAKGKEAGGEFRTSKFGPYFLWPEDTKI